MNRSSPMSVRRGARFVAASLTAFALFVTVSGSAQAVAVAVPLGTATSFVVLAGTGVTNTGPTTLNGDLGSYPTDSLTGGGTLTINGTNHAANGTTQSAKTDLTAAYNNAAGQGPVDGTISANLAGQTLLPGVYFQGATMALNGVLTLDAEGDPDAVWVFQAGSDLVVGSGSSVLLAGGAQSCNIFWQVTSSASIGTGALFRGTIMATTSITLDTGAELVGRALAQNGTVTLDTNVISRPFCAAAPAPSGGVATGDGSSSDVGGSNSVYLLAGAVLVASLGSVALFGARRRENSNG